MTHLPKSATESWWQTQKKKAAKRHEERRVRIQRLAFKKNVVAENVLASLEAGEARWTQDGEVVWERVETWG